MISESKPLPEEMLKETYVLLSEAVVLWGALRLHYEFDGAMPRQLMDMLDKRFSETLKNLEDCINPLPF